METYFQVILLVVGPGWGSFPPKTSYLNLDFWAKFKQEYDPWYIRLKLNKKYGKVYPDLQN